MKARPAGAVRLFRGLDGTPFTAGVRPDSKGLVTAE